ncbi:MAG: antitoxin family protein [bacterium]|nr:antitoxin family protein [bacterium]
MLTKTVGAIYEDGILKLEESMELAEKTRLRVIIELPDPTDDWESAGSNRGGEMRTGLRSLLREPRRKAPPGAGAFDSGHTDTAERAEALLAELGWGEDGV